MVLGRHGRRAIPTVTVAAKAGRTVARGDLGGSDLLADLYSGPLVFHAAVKNARRRPLSITVAKTNPVPSPPDYPHL